MQKDMERKYTGWKEVATETFRFEKDEVYLGLGENSTTSEDGCWTVSADKPDRVCKVPCGIA